MPNSIRLKQSALFLFIFLPILLTVTGCGTNTNANSDTELKMAPLSDMPDEIQQSAVSVQEAYRFVVANPEALQSVPCYCGCDAAGHTSNYSCYVDEDLSTSDELVFETHALGCTICVDITQDVMKMTARGEKPADIFSAIDTVYSQYGPSNMPAD